MPGAGQARSGHAPIASRSVPSPRADVPMLVAELGAQGAGARSEALLGVDLLKRYVLRIDYPRKRLWIAEPARCVAVAILRAVLSVDAVRRALARHEPKLVDDPARPRAAVAVVLRDAAAGPEVLLIERARHPEDPWSGHMAFPGGRVDPGDSDTRAAAERETLEEVGLSLAGAEPLGRLDDLEGRHAGRPLPLVISAWVYHVTEPRPLALNHEVADDAVGAARAPRRSGPARRVPDTDRRLPRHPRRRARPPHRLGPHLPLPRDLPRPPRCPASGALASARHSRIETWRGRPKPQSRAARFGSRSEPKASVRDAHERSRSRSATDRLTERAASSPSAG